MKYICLGYYDKSKHDAMTEAEKQAMFDACFTYDDHLRANGHWVGWLCYTPLAAFMDFAAKHAAPPLRYSFEDLEEERQSADRLKA